MSSRVSYPAAAWAALVFTLFVVLWGGFVSASGAGDGCGDDWPLCGELLSPSDGTTPADAADTLVEFTHRLTSGLALLAVAGLAVWSRYRFPPGHRARYWAALGLAFMVVESLIGAALVIFQWVDMNVSLARALVQPVHLANTYLLMGALACAAWWSGPRKPAAVLDPGRPDRLVAAALGGLIVVSAFGTAASLASTVFPSESFLDGVRSDFAGGAHYLIRLRVWHPVAVLAFGGYLVWLGRRLGKTHPDSVPAPFHHLVAAVFATQLAVGALDAVLLAPIALQMAHLFLAHALWLGLLALWLRLRSEPESTSLDGPVTRNSAGSMTPPVRSFGGGPSPPVAASRTGATSSAAVTIAGPCRR